MSVCSSTMYNEYSFCSTYCTRVEKKTRYFSFSLSFFCKSNAVVGAPQTTKKDIKSALGKMSALVFKKHVSSLYFSWRYISKSCSPVSFRATPLPPELRYFLWYFLSILITEIVFQILKYIQYGICFDCVCRKYVWNLHNKVK